MRRLARSGTITPVPQPIGNIQKYSAEADKQSARESDYRRHLGEAEQ